jgi:N-dimethylarginine dimethylaminohydrolase
MTMTARTGRPADVLRQNEDSAHGGAGWIGREGTLRAELGTVWAACGVPAEYGRLRSVLMHRPGPEIEEIADHREALWLAPIDPGTAREQHDAFRAFYESHGVAVHLLGEADPAKPNSYFCRDVFCMSPDGAIISRMASAKRAGEERVAAAALARIGVPIAATISGDGLYEGADVVIANEDLVFVGQGMRSNRSGAEQVAAAFHRSGVPQVEIVQIPYGCGHIDGTLNLIDRDLALVMPTQLSYVVYETLRRHGFRIVDLPDLAEAQGGMAINLVPLAPGVVVMPAGNPLTRAALEREGVEVHEVEISELMKGGGAVHCMTGVIHRDRP